MPITELRILPPLAIGRLGSSTEPLENYSLSLEDKLGYRQIRPADSLRVDAKTGEISQAYTPAEPIRFRDGPAIRPVAPFLEVFARTADDAIIPLTASMLEAEGFSPADLKWTVTVGNTKAFRRTKDPNDRIFASATFNDHEIHPLDGTCSNFLAGARLPFGSVRYIRPTEAFPEIRLRFTPASGVVYGASKVRNTAEGVNGPVSEDDPVVGERVIYDEARGSWRGHVERGAPENTNPGAIFAGYDVGDDRKSWGYLDDECDGIVSVELAISGKVLRAFSRIGAGPPAFAPDSFPIRTVADELEQALLGPEAADADATSEAVEDIVRRALETVRLLNTAVMNGNPVDGRPFTASNMPGQDANDHHRAYGPIMAPTLVDNLSVLALHQSILTALASGTPPWFSDVLRKPEEIGDLSDKGRRKMPAMMRGADARYLTLTRRQIDIIRKSALRGLFE